MLTLSLISKVRVPGDWTQSLTDTGSGAVEFLSDDLRVGRGDNAGSGRSAAVFEETVGWAQAADIRGKSLRKVLNLMIIIYGYYVFKK